MSPCAKCQRNSGPLPLSSPPPPTAWSSTSISHLEVSLVDQRRNLRGILSSSLTLCYNLCPSPVISPPKYPLMLSISPPSSCHRPSPSHQHAAMTAMPASSPASNFLHRTGVLTYKRCTEQINHSHAVASASSAGLSLWPSFVSSWPVLFVLHRSLG